jgi:hypothetical protein
MDTSTDVHYNTIGLDEHISSDDVIQYCVYPKFVFFLSGVYKFLRTGYVQEITVV